MKKTETLRGLAASENEKSIASLRVRIEALRQAKIESAEQLAEMLEPLARSMAVLSVETSETLGTIGQRSRQLGDEFRKETQAAMASLGEGIDDGALRGRPSGRIEPKIDLEHPSRLASDRSDERSPSERILALAGAADNQQPDGCGGDRAPAKTRDRSLEAIERQIAAMGSERFDVRIRSVARGTEVTRNWSQQELRRSVPWLKRMNALGHDVGIRPSGRHGLILITNLDPATLLKVQALGLSPAVTLETSPSEYEAWIKLSEMPVANSIRAAILVGAQRHLRACEAGSDSNPYGYLAGMTNHAAALRDRSKSRYVIARTAEGVVAENGKKLIDAIEASHDHAITTSAAEPNETNDRQMSKRDPQRERGPSR